MTMILAARPAKRGRGGRHAAPSVRLRTGRPILSLGVVVLATGLFMSVSVPASAAVYDPDAATGGAIPSAATMRAASVSFAVDADAVSTEFTRDGYSATPQSDVDAANAAAAAAAAAQAEADAKAAAAAAAAAANDDADSSDDSSGSGDSKPFTETPAASRSGAAILEYAAQFVGVVPYGNGNDPNDSFACDGYVQYVYKAFGVNLPRGAGAQANYGVRISASEAQAGDLLYWSEGHIGIYDGNGGMYDSPDWGRMVQHRLSIWGSPQYIRIP